MQNAVIIVAAGRGVRASGNDRRPKQYRDIAGKSVLELSLNAFVNHEAITLVQPVIHQDDETLYNQMIDGLNSAKLLKAVSGGASRQQSVLAGLRALQAYAPVNVLIHDAARPFVSSKIISDITDSLNDNTACLAALPLSDTLKAERSGCVARTIRREGLWRAQTPQAFRFDAILAAHEAAEADNLHDFTDDAAIAEWRGIEVALVLGSERNVKLTTPEDFDLAERLLRCEHPMRETRTATGFDVHACEAGDQIILCGITIPHDTKLIGHSDADVGLHALTDALLGTIGAGDIGQHFPPSDPKWKGSDSAVFLSHTAGLIAKEGGKITHVDVTLICERPKIGPHRDAMCNRIADILNVERSRVSVKATTTEGLGFPGRHEGIAAMASATVELVRDEAND